MNAMEKMLASMLSSLVPPEVMELLSAENINKFVEQVKAERDKLETALSHIEMRLGNLEEGLENAGCKYIGRAGKRISDNSNGNVSG